MGDILANFNYSKDWLDQDDWGLITAKGSRLYIGGYHRFIIRKNIKSDFFFCIGHDKDRRYTAKPAFANLYIIPNDSSISKLPALSASMNGPIIVDLKKFQNLGTTYFIRKVG